MRPETEEILEAIERLAKICMEPTQPAAPGGCIGMRPYSIQTALDGLCASLQTTLTAPRNSGQ